MKAQQKVVIAGRDVLAINGTWLGFIEYAPLRLDGYSYLPGDLIEVWVRSGRKKGLKNFKGDGAAILVTF